NLYITGRSKDLIFINGTNFYAHDLETIALKLEGINYGKIVIAGSFDEDDGRDKLLIFLVGAKSDETIELCLRLKNHFANMVGLVTETFIAVKSSDIPRTSSGKLQRYKMVERYLKGDFGKVVFPIILLIWLVSLSCSVFSQNGIIKGRVFNHKNNEPVPFVNIIIDGKPTQGATSDLDGNYKITQVEPGYKRLAATSVGFKKFVSDDFLVTNSKTTDINIGMDELVVTLSQVEIRPSVVERNEEVPVSLQKLTIQEIERSPGSNRDISKVIQSLPGVASSPSFRNDVIVRGGGPGENRFYLDGVEIPYINHFSTQGASGGPVGIINVDFIREVQLYSSAFPVSRGNALSSVMDLRQVDGNKEKFGGRVSLGSSDLALTLNGPVSHNSSVIFSVRRSYLQLLFSALKLPFLPTYNDYQFKYKIDIDKRNQLSIISIGALDINKLNTGIANPDAFQRYIIQSLPVNNQWSYVFGLVYRHFRAKGHDTWVLSRNMLNNDQVKYTNNVEVPDSLLLKYNSREIENKLRYEGLTDLVSWKITYGAGLEYAKYT
ncbi:MAG: carboxypeptidase-like regulatory domain-containing protein, partial [Bacteroidetes bacterium]|nr:carboxypeptidase-like regulatory domain-containing protein [Bacteroidota bacterium]